MTDLYTRFIIAAALIVAASSHSSLAASDIVTLGDRPPQTVIVRDLIAEDDAVSGFVVNNSTRLVRDVRLLIRHNWLWNNERFPGEDSPGRSAYYVVPNDIPPGGRAPLTYHPNPPLPARSDGRFTTSAEVVGFTEVGE